MIWGSRCQMRKGTLSRVHSSSKCSRHALIQLKVLHYSKDKLGCKQTPATIYHTLWSCPKLAPFWSSFFDIVSKTYGCNVMPSPTSAIFGIFSVPDDYSLPAHLQKVIAFPSLLARRSILFKWKDVTSSVTQPDVRQNIRLEKNQTHPQRLH